MNTIPSELDKYNASTKVCPKVGCTAGGARQDIETMFGWRTVNGKKVAQSYCTNCRQGKKQLALFPAVEKVVGQMSSAAEIAAYPTGDEYQAAMREDDPNPPQNFETAQHDPGHAFKVIEQFAKQKLGLFEHAITPNHAATILHLVTGCGKRDRDEEDTDSKFSLIIRAEASLSGIPPFKPWHMPEWSSYNGFSRGGWSDNQGDEKCTNERRLANALLRWGLALVAWCDEEQPRREDIERRMKKKEQAEKEKKAAALAKRKAKGGKAKTRDPYGDDDEEEDEENGDD